METGRSIRRATESSTGVRNDVQALGQAVSALPDTCFVVDAITGLGTTELRPDEWDIDLMIGGSQKATMIPPGLAFASVSEKAWKTIDVAFDFKDLVPQGMNVFETADDVYEVGTCVAIK